MEFQFGTNRASFSKYGGGVIGQTLAMEGMGRGLSAVRLQ
jgi:cytochrome d ubiquinol oxidase subunit I